MLIFYSKSHIFSLHDHYVFLIYQIYQCNDSYAVHFVLSKVYFWSQMNQKGFSPHLYEMYLTMIHTNLLAILAKVV